MVPEVVAAVAEVVGGKKVNVSLLCREHGLSRDTFYRYVARFRTEGVAAFTPRPSVPLTSPTRLSERVADAVVRARKELAEEGLDHGPISIGWRLEDELFQPLPSRASIYRILVERGVIIPRPRKKVRGKHRFEYPAPNACWQLDGTEHTLASGRVVCVLQLIDDHSRYDLGTFAAHSENAEDTCKALERATTDHGAPVRLLTDNGTAFSGKRRGYLSVVERFVAVWGTKSIASSTYHPQTCGKNERSHQTLRQWLAARPPAEDLTELQQLLDLYREIYNHRRHQGIGGQTPHHRYHATPKHTPAKPGSRTAASGQTQRAISATAVVAFSGCSIVLERRHAGKTAHIIWQGARVVVMVDNTIARQLILDRSVRYQRLKHHNCQ